MIASLLIKELEQEMEVSYKMLALVPADTLEWQPHQKSMTLGKLASHITEICSWVKFCIDRTEMDFGIEKWESPNSHDGLGFMTIAKNLGFESVEALKQTNDDILLNQRWAMKYHGQIIMDFTKYEAIRHCISQMIHHRAQLGVFLRLLNISIPGTYGPSADSMN